MGLHPVVQPAQGGQVVGAGLAGWAGLVVGVDVVEVAGPGRPVAPRVHTGPVAQPDVLGDPLRHLVGVRSERLVEIDDWSDGDPGGVLPPAPLGDLVSGQEPTSGVLDLHQPQAVDGYAVPARIAETIQLRDRTCVFPWCHRPARSCDLDHITPYYPGGPPGQTSTQNLAALCRLHHRMKTHGGWTYTTLEPGVFLWRSPYGYTYLRDSGGTTDLTPNPVEPPIDPPHRRTS